MFPTLLLAVRISLLFINQSRKNFTDPGLHKIRHSSLVCCLDLALLHFFTFIAPACLVRVDKYWSSSLFRMFIDLAFSSIKELVKKKGSRPLFPQYGPHTCASTTSFPGSGAEQERTLGTKSVAQPSHSSSFNFNFLCYRLLPKFAVNLLILSQEMEKQKLWMCRWHDRILCLRSEITARMDCLLHRRPA